jgi:uncharacterized protein (TIGR00255 family)
VGIQSMTGFGKAQFQSENHNLLVEIKSVNNRFIDTRFRIPGEFNQLEIKFKKNISRFFKRGSFDTYISYQPLQSGSSDRLDKEKIKNLVCELKEISKELDVKIDFSAGDFLKPEFYRASETDPLEKEKLSILVDEVFEKALINLNESRQSEGLKLFEIMNDHLKKLRESFLKIGPLEKNYQELVESRLRAKFLDFKTELKLDENRYHQEVIYYLERLDIKEEINRIGGHLTEFDRILDSSGEVGRRLDFLVQELNRETNTLGAKSGLKEISDIVLEMKMELEKMREQVANLE